MQVTSTALPTDPPILISTHHPAAPARATVVIAHGYMGYKDYGMFPRLAHELSTRADCIAHRMSFSHCGMTESEGPFSRPDLFARDTWKQQAADVDRVFDAIASDEIAGSGLPLFLVGHSRGGVTALLSAADRIRRGKSPALSGVITLAARSQCGSMTPEDQERMLADGGIDVVSNRTGQTLRIDAVWLQDQLEDPVWHDVPTAAGVIDCPLLVVHGTEDPTVDVRCADEIARAARRATLHIVDGADHTFNTPNPFGLEGSLHDYLESVVESVASFIASHSNHSA